MGAILRLLFVYSIVAVVCSSTEQTDKEVKKPGDLVPGNFPTESVQRNLSNTTTVFQILLKNKKTIQLGKVNVTAVRNITTEPFLKNLDTLEETQKENLWDLNYETLDSSGNLSRTEVGFEYVPSNVGPPSAGNPSESVTIEEQPEQIWDDSNLPFAAAYTNTLRERIRRIIFKKDDRTLVPSKSRAQKFPFSAVVKVSTGCTGTLISRRHVLVSAHCVHDGKKYLAPISSIRVGFLRRNGKMRWVKAAQVTLPSGWSERRNVVYDYAVLKLNRAHRRPFMVVGALTNSPKRVKIHFAGFPGDKEGGDFMWYSHCSAKVLPQLILSRCDATGGNSGSGVFVRFRKGGKGYRILIGILSGYGAIRNHRGKIRYYRNVATKITPLKVQQICTWISEYSNCSTYNFGS